jgi:hypothetical protein
MLSLPAFAQHLFGMLRTFLYLFAQNADFNDKQGGEKREEDEERESNRAGIDV